MSRPVVLAMGVCLLYFVHRTGAKTFGKCELAIELRKQGFPEHQLADWICLVDAESTGVTSAVGGPNWDGSYDYGLFQINSRYWCQADGQSSNGCNIQCKDFLWDDITQASTCAKKIYNIHGFEAWAGWKSKCAGHALQPVVC